MNKQVERGKTRIERTYHAQLADVWEMWTTKDGIESWWGPDGFKVLVHRLEVRAGGTLSYDMIAVDPDKIAFMKEAGMPVSTPALMVFTEVVPQKRLAYKHAVDFVPGVDAYDVLHVIDFEQSDADHVRLVLTIDAMHDEEWTHRAVSGWEEELGKLATALRDKQP